MNQKKKILLLLILGGLSAFAFAPCYIVPFMMLGVFVLMKFLNKNEKHILALLMGFLLALAWVLLAHIGLIML